MIVLHCVFCLAGYRSAGAVPATCPSCGKSTRWKTAPEAADPLVPWELTWADKRFLRLNRITADEPIASS